MFADPKSSLEIGYTFGTLNIQCAANFLMVGTFRLQTGLDVSTRQIHVIGGIISFFDGLARVIVQTLEMMVIQSEKWQLPLTCHVHIRTRHFHAEKK